MAYPDLRSRQKAMRASPVTQALRQVLRPRFVEQDGLRLLVPYGRASPGIVRQLYRGVYETTKRLVAETLLRANDRVLEAGAGMGQVTLAAARIAGANRVVCYEALPDACAIIAANLALNGLRAEVRQRAVAPNAGSLIFHVNEDIISSSTAVGRGHRTISVLADGIGDMIAELRPHVLLMDIEGSEAEVLPACPLEGLRAVMVQIHADIVSDAAASAIMARFINAGLLYRHTQSIGNIWAFSRES